MSEQFEVERKYALGKGDLARVRKRLTEEGFVFVGTRHQQDHFVPGTRKHELLRVRREGTQHFALTFKERIVIDGEKTRRESEPEIHPIAAHLIVEAASRELRAPLPTLYKKRRDFKRAWGGFVAHVVLDYVPELGELFSSYFMEVEIIVEDAGEVARAKKLVKKIAERLLGEKRKRNKLSYRRMLFKTLKARKRFPKRWSRLTGKKKGRLDPRDTGAIGFSPTGQKVKQSKRSRKKAA
ncbi:MAG: CYTH domain-containing protein [Candidatus Melainabacteria bacterium]|nr:CYTH domain-containing protein [Candidatus Melainabacteria bacterium]